MNNDIEPNHYYRPWLEEHVGQQGKDWDWRIGFTNGDNLLAIDFANKEQATFFELSRS
jgi:hypothetical protein